MKSFLSGRFSALTPYVPGEQPKKVQDLIKLNTNESPFPPAPGVVRAAAEAAEGLNLYSDTMATRLISAYAEKWGVSSKNVVATNGSDEILYFAFLAFGDREHGFAFPDITYGFYPVYAALNRIPATVIPLRQDFTVDVENYCGIGKNVVLANPNAPTGIPIPAREIERIVKSNPDHVVVIDEAYADFGGESVVPLIQKYDNLLVTHTFSKSRSLAGARLGFGIGSEGLIRDINTIRFSTNPYNVNAMTQSAGLAAIQEEAYYRGCVDEICRVRDDTAQRLRDLGFTVLPSATNFLFAGHGPVSGGELFSRLREKNIIVRHFDAPRLADFLRISIGTQEQMEHVMQAIQTILDQKE